MTWQGNVPQGRCFLTINLVSLRDNEFMKVLRNATVLRETYVIIMWCDMVALRRRNRRYKNPQLVAQHCFVASLGWCFAIFTLRDQLDAQQKHLLRVEMQRADWLICLSVSKFVAWQVVSLMKNEQLYFSQQFSATSWSRKVKNAKHRPETCNEKMLGDKLRGFVFRISPPLGKLPCFFCENHVAKISLHLNKQISKAKFTWKVHILQATVTFCTLSAVVVSNTRMWYFFHFFVTPSGTFEEPPKTEHSSEEQDKKSEKPLRWDFFI